MNRLVCIKSFGIYTIDSIYTYSKCYDGTQYAIYKIKNNLTGSFIGVINVGLLKNFITFEKYIQELNSIDCLFEKYLG